MKRRNFLRGILWSCGAAAAVGVNVAWWNFRRSRKTLPVRLNELPGTPDHDVYSVAFSLSGNQLVSATTDRQLSLWDCENGKVEFTRKGPYSAGSVCVSLFNDGGWVAAVSEDRTLSVWNSLTQKEGASISRLQSKPTAVAFGPSLGGFQRNRHRLAVAQEDRTIRIFERAEGGFSEPDFGMGASKCCGTQAVLNQREFQETRVLDQKYGVAKSLIFSPDGNYLVATLGGNYLQTWALGHNWSQGAISSLLYSPPLNAAAFSPDSRLLAAGADDGTVVILDWQSRNQIAQLDKRGSAVVDLAFFGTENWIMVAYADGVNQIWTGRNGNKGLTVGRNPGKHTSISRSANGQYLASAWGTDIRFWKTADLVAEGKKA